MLLNADCLTILPTIPTGSVHLVMMDLPFAQTKTSWDCAIDLEAIWRELRRILTDTGTVAAFGSGPFVIRQAAPASDLYKYDLIWVKSGVTQNMHVHDRPLPQHEVISIFSRGVVTHRTQSARRMTYNADGYVEPARGRTWQQGMYSCRRTPSSDYMALRGSTRSLIFAPKCAQTKARHNCAKPLELTRWLIERYSHPGDTILDPTMGSGSAIVAARFTGRKFIGIERDPTIFAKAKALIESDITIGDLPNISHQRHDATSQIFHPTSQTSQKGIADSPSIHDVPRQQKGVFTMNTNPIVAAIDDQIADLHRQLDKLARARAIVANDDESTVVESAAPVHAEAPQSAPEVAPVLTQRKPTRVAPRASAATHEAKRTGPGKMLGDQVVSTIRTRRARGEKIDDLATEFKVSRGTIHNVINRQKSYA